jgi:iron donor protein CyaY
MARATLTEVEFRANLDSLFKRIQKAFDAVDPDAAECEIQFGALTVLLPQKKSKIILSGQPSVRQLWMAVASRGIAHHFDWHGEAGKWTDDKGLGLEVESYFKGLLKEEIGAELRLEKE